MINEESKFMDNLVKRRQNECIKCNNNKSLDMATYKNEPTSGTFDSLFTDSCLGLDVLHNLENDLEIYEKVSLVFLLYDDVYIAQQSIVLILKAREGSDSTKSTYNNLIHPWACSYGKYWREKLVEGLLIVQAFSNIDKLGLKLELLNNHFLPKCSETSTFIHPVKKMLYKICESMTIENTKMVIEAIMNDERCPHFKIEDNYQIFFELFLLKLLETKYITVGSWKPSVISEELKTKIPSQMGSLVSVLKQLRLGAHWSNLKDSEKLINSDLKISDVDDNSNPSTSYFRNNTFRKLIDNVNEISNTLSCSIQLESRDTYPIIDENKMGIVLIINQTIFNKTGQSGSDEYGLLENREGSNADRDRLIEVWEKYGFQPIVYENLNHNDIQIKIKHVIDKKTKCTDSAFVICILSHGRDGIVFGSDSIPVEVRNIEKLLYGSAAVSLIGKPKIIIIQACRGEYIMKILQAPMVTLPDPNIKTDGPSLQFPISLIPERADLLCYWATGPECVSYRDIITGSWFIQTFCHVLEKYGELTEFNDMCRMVNDIISRKRNAGTGQMPEIISSCRKQFFLRQNRST